MKKELSTKKQFIEALKYVKESRNYIYSAIAIFILSFFLGFIFREHLGFFDEIIKELISTTKDMNAPQLIFFIFQNNLHSAFLGILTGIAFGIFPIFYTILNGLVVGYVVGLASQIEGISTIFQLAPHGIFELPAIFISFGLGIKLGTSLFTKKKARIKEFKRRFYESANAFLMIILPLLIIAAIIEGILIALVG